jgi:hypothetical protein
MMVDVSQRLHRWLVVAGCDLDGGDYSRIPSRPVPLQDCLLQHPARGQAAIPSMGSSAQLVGVANERRRPRTR